ncbi:molybdenum cofactor biosynthesis protein MoeA [Caldimicrobium thiodismutans]|uniref:GTP 3',8-cyclase n=1 Tax=Caldimicrobium thiodismutans TaxID=1653476 RepID=A0A0U5ANR3_9BACT|nr:GTP 3',8-cyclase MoaA [Caldimicrobium thiodismutans]BAU23522.1 molybdenum cofactor biosynthesis protein MoeA [Caldimicrobium thiodismutans]
MLIDNYGRKIEYLRISVTDRCNFRCIYCQSREPIKFIPHEELLTYEEIEEVVRTAVELGVKRVRLTGGEPLGRKGIEGLVERLSKIEGLQDLSLTTNGYLLLEKAEILKRAGLKRLNISLDTLKEEKFEKITGGFSFDKIWKGVLKALEVGFEPLKINMVVIRGLNDDEIIDMAKLTLRYPWEIRFIEFMPIGGSVLWNEENVVSISEIKKILETFFPLEPVSSFGGGPARVFKWKDAVGKLGFISPLSEHFCNKCNRFRITANGMLRTCLFSDEEINLKDYLRGGKGSLKEAFFLALQRKPEKRLLKPTQRPMRAIGG